MCRLGSKTFGVNAFNVTRKEIGMVPGNVTIVFPTSKYRGIGDSQPVLQRNYSGQLWLLRSCVEIR